MDFNTSKTLGGVGALLLFIVFVPYNFGIIPLIGAILLLIGLKGLADTYREAGIFNNALYGIVSLIVGAIATVGIALFALADFFTTVFGTTVTLSNVSDWASIFRSTNWQNVFDQLSAGTIWRFVGYVFLAVVVLFIFVVIAAVFMRKSLNLLREKSNVGLFGTTGMILLVGAVLTIIIFGLLLIWISALLLAIAFFSMRPPQTQTQPPPPTEKQVQM